MLIKLKKLGGFIGKIKGKLHDYKLYCKLLWKKLLPFYRHRVFYTQDAGTLMFEVYNKVHCGVGDRANIFEMPKVVDNNTISYEKSHIFSSWKRTMSRGYSIYLDNNEKTLK